jgi:hypothetical protein
MIGVEQGGFMRRIAAWRVVIVAVVVAVCTTGTTAGSDSTMSPPTVSATETPPSSVATSTTVPESSTTTLPRPTTTSLVLPPPAVVVPLDPTLYEGEEQVWVRAQARFDRDRQYWLGVHGDEFVLFSWRWSGLDPAIQRSENGVDWSGPDALTGLPIDADPDMWRWERGISASPIGLIALFETTRGIDAGWGGRSVFTSTDGVAWSREDLPAINGDAGWGGPFAVAAGNDGYAVWTTADERRRRSDVLFVRPSHGDWQAVDLPERGESWENWVVGAHSGFLARVDTLPKANEATHPVYRVSTTGVVSVEAIPTDQPPIEWNDNLLIHGPYNNVPKPALYAGPDGTTWYRLPTPDFSINEDERFWGIDALTAGQTGITVAGCACGECWGFLGEAMVTIEVPNSGYHVTVHGDQVTVDGVWDHPIRVDTKSWFDPVTGMLTVPDPDTGEPIAIVTCDEMRASARENMHEPELLTPPPQDLLYSPDGTAWNHSQVNDLFGVGSYVHQAATTGDAIVLFADRTGEAPTPDPPGCPLDIYPEVRSFEVWVATPNLHP